MSTAAAPEKTNTLATRVKLWFEEMCRQGWHHLSGKGEGDDSDVFTAEKHRGAMYRCAIAGTVMLGAFAYLITHVYDVQVRRHEFFVEQSLEICQRVSRSTAPRGQIMDINGNVFACDVATLNVCAEPRRFQNNIDTAAEIIARHLKLDEAKLRNRFTAAAQYNDFKFRVSPNPVTMEFIQENALMQIPGVKLRCEKDPASGKWHFMVDFLPGGLTPAKRRASCRKLAQIFLWDEDQLINKAEETVNRCKQIVVRNNAKREDTERMLDELRRNKIVSGIYTQESWTRTYPRDAVLANMLGYLDENRNGRSGVEALMDKYMQPTQGKVVYRRDRQGRPIEDGISEEKNAVPGCDVFLTIDEPLQQIVEEELLQMCRDTNCNRAYAIMVDPSTGAVMALAQYPQFNPNDRSSWKDMSALQNHCLIQNYDPGSIMKAISITGVLDAQLATLDTMVDCENGRWYYAGRPLRDSHGYDTLSLAEVVQKSSNIGSAKLAMLMGDEAFYNHLTGYGFGKPTQLGFHPEGREPTVFKQEFTGGFPQLRKWGKITITRVAIGHGISMSPMQIIQGWMAVANNGVMMQPYIVDRVRYPDGTVEYSKPHIKGRASSEESARQMVQALKLVTEQGGTGRRAAVEGYDIAGKTGTAQQMVKQKYVDRQGKERYRFVYSNNQYFASFVGFAPAENPRFLLLVSAEDPKGKYHTGGGVGAPVFKRIATRTLEYLQVPSNNIDATNNTTHTANVR